MKARLIMKSKLFRIQLESYQFYYNDNLCEDRDEFKDLLKGGLIIEDLDLCKLDSGILFDKNTCGYNKFDKIYWLDSEDMPENIGYNDKDECYDYIENLIYGYYYRNNEGYFSSDDNYLIYRDEYYHEDSFDYHNLTDISGNLYSTDDVCYCEDSGDYELQDNCYYSDIDNCYYSDSDNMPENKKGLKNYHDSNIDFKNENSKYRIGFEIEKEDSNFTNFDKLREIGWDAERDGSLDSQTGFEMVSAVYDLMDLKTFKEDTSEIKDFINADYSRSCGGHINISIQDLTNIEVFELIKGYAPLIFAMYYGRIENTYCKAKKVELNDMERYSAFNFTKRNGILEIRIFSAVPNLDTLIFRTELLQFMFKNSRKGSASVIGMLLNEDSKLTKLLKIVYSDEKYKKLVDRTINYTDVYSTLKDIKQTENKLNKLNKSKLCA